MEPPHSNDNNQPQPASDLVGSQRAEGEQSSATSLPTNTNELQPSSSATAIVTPSSTNITHLEIAPGLNDDPPPVPAAQTDVAYKEMENAIKTSIENTSASDDAPPLPAAQIAAPFEDMENAIKGSLKGDNDTPPLRHTEIARFYEETGNEKKGAKGKLQMIEESQTAMPITPSSSGIHHRSPTVLQISSESPSPRASPSQNSQTQSRRGQCQAAAMIHCPPQSMAASLNDEARPPSVPMFHQIEATLAPEPPPVPDIPVYDGVQVPNEDSTPLPCWKRHQKSIFVGVWLLGVGVAVAVGFLLGANNKARKESVRFAVSSTSPSLWPSTSIAPTKIPTLRPSNKPSTSFSPSLHPSQSFAPSPNPSFSPSTYFSSFYWKQQGQAIIGDAADDHSGTSVALSANGNDLAIGSPGKHDNEDRPGYVKVYHREDTESSWELVHTIFGSVYGDLFGGGVSFSEDGTTLAIGASGYFGNNDRPGYVRVYFTEGNSSGRIWQQLGEDIRGEAFGELSGSSLSLSGDGKTLAIGAKGNDGVNGDNSGYVMVYGLDGNDTALSWKQLGQNIDGEAAGDWSGWSNSLSADGKTVAIGAPYNGTPYNDENGDQLGHVRVYHMVEDDTGPIWQQLGQDIAGFSMSLSPDGKTLAIGAAQYFTTGENPGYVRVYHLEGDGSSPIWKQFGQDIDGQTDNDYSGFSVSLSADGKILAIGAPNNNSFTGHVRVYHIDEVGTQPIWKQLGHDIDGEGGAYFGWSVSLSADGKTVAIGSPGSYSWHASVFNIDF